jgi:hypothetical protein
MKIKKFIYDTFVLMVICLSFSIALGETAKKAIPFPQDIDEQKVMEVAIKECMKMDYDLQKEEGKTLFKKNNPPIIGTSHILLIKLSVVPGENGNKVLSLDGESIGHPQLSPILDRDVRQIEKAVKKYLEPGNN